MSDPKDWETDPELTIARLRAELAAAERERDRMRDYFVTVSNLYRFERESDKAMAEIDQMMKELGL